MELREAAVALYNACQTLLYQANNPERELSPLIREAMDEVGLALGGEPSCPDCEFVAGLHHRHCSRKEVAS